MRAPFPCHPIPSVAAEIEAAAALTARAERLGIGAAVEIAPGATCGPETAAMFARPETAETMAPRGCPVARDVGVSDTNPDGPHPGNHWVDICLTDGRHLAAILSPEMLAKLAAQAARQAS